MPMHLLYPFKITPFTVNPSFISPLHAKLLKLIQIHCGNVQAFIPM